MAIEASFVLAPVLDESALIYNACEKLNSGLADGTGSPAFNSKGPPPTISENAFITNSIP